MSNIIEQSANLPKIQRETSDLNRMLMHNNVQYVPEVKMKSSGNPPRTRTVHVSPHEVQ